MRRLRATGPVDFLARRWPEQVFLRGRFGEPEDRDRHSLQEGFAGRKALEDPVD